VSVRIIAATHRNLEAAVAAGAFREDLYYRLKVITIAIPPLRERRDDIPILAQHFVTQYGRELGRTVTGLSVAAHAILENYDWPGNVRELQNVIQRALLMTSGPVVRSEHLIFNRTRGFPGSATPSVNGWKPRFAIPKAITNASP
jgi:transcriptional regulator with PAS, ATPase and Fis domain